MTKPEAALLVRELKTIFDTVRLVDVPRALAYDIDEDGNLAPQEAYCHAAWNREERCENCSSSLAYAQKARKTKYEFVGSDIYYVVSKYLEVDGKGYALEIISDVSNEMIFSTLGKDRMVKRIQNYGKNIYRDAVTGAYNREYLEEQRAGLRSAQAASMLSIDNLDAIERKFGPEASDAALRAIGQYLLSHVRSSDPVMRCAADRFLIVFRGIPKDAFARKLSETLESVEGLELSGWPKVRISASIGGCYQSGQYSDLLESARQALGKAKMNETKICFED